MTKPPIPTKRRMTKAQFEGYMVSMLMSMFNTKKRNAKLILNAVTYWMQKFFMDHRYFMLDQCFNVSVWVRSWWVTKSWLKHAKGIFKFWPSKTLKWELVRKLKRWKRDIKYKKVNWF